MCDCNHYLLLVNLSSGKMSRWHQCRSKLKNETWGIFCWWTWNVGEDVGPYFVLHSFLFVGLLVSVALDFWWPLPWVSKPRGLLACMFHRLQVVGSSDIPSRPLNILIGFKVLARVVDMSYGYKTLYKNGAHRTKGESDWRFSKIVWDDAWIV